MKKFLVPLSFFLVFGCSNDFNSRAASEQKEVYCFIAADKCPLISESLCAEIGGVAGCNVAPGVESSSSIDEGGSSSSEEASSSSGVDVSSSSRSSSSRSSSSRDSSSSSGNEVDDSSSSVPPSLSSSSEEPLPLSSSEGVTTSSSSTAVSSSSSVVASSSSSLPVPSLGDCSPFPSPFYVSRAKEESINDLVPVINDYNRCNVTYTLSSSSGGPPGGGSNPTISASSISFAAVSASSTPRNITINARAQCEGIATPLTKSCTISVVVAEKFAKIEKCHDPRVSVGPGTTVVEITCVNGEPPATTTPASTFGCDCSGGDWSNDNIFTLNGNRAAPSGCWAIAPIPPADASKEIKRVLINYTREIGCVAY